MDNKNKKVQVDEEAEARINLAYALEAERLNPELKKGRLELHRQMAKYDEQSKDNKDE